MATAENVEVGGEESLGQAGATKRLRKLADKYEYLKEHLIEFKREYGSLPQLVKKPLRNEQIDNYAREKSNILYQTDDLLFAHLLEGGREFGNRYYVIEPTLNEEEKELFEKIKTDIFTSSTSSPLSGEKEESGERLEEIFDEIVSIEGEEEGGVLDVLGGGDTSQFTVSELKYRKLLYMLKRDIIEMGGLTPLLRDRTNEDIHVVSPHDVYIYNKVYGSMETNVDLGPEEEYQSWLKAMTERLGSPASDGNPLIDTTLPDGSRLNVVYPNDVSIRGPSLTIRQFEEYTPSILQVIRWGTLSPELGAYLWLCIENNMSVAVCGETAAGKTTTLNALTSFIPEDHKIVSAEDTLELKIPHETWQRLLTREGEGEEADVDMFDLIIASLRARPDNLIIGEVRGKEASNVFLAMQTGHPTMFTFHAGNIAALVNRFTGEPLNVPETYFGNLSVAVFQNFIKTGERELRRITSVQEIEGYSKHVGGIVTSKVFDWDPHRDQTRFLGKNNSYVLEEKVAEAMGLSDPVDIYEELKQRARVIERALTEDILGYEACNEIIRAYQREGVNGADKAIEDNR